MMYHGTYRCRHRSVGAIAAVQGGMLVDSAWKEGRRVCLTIRCGLVRSKAWVVIMHMIEPQKHIRSVYRIMAGCLK